MVQEAIAGSAFLVLGYKGSGKTAIAERIRLLAEGDPALFVTTTTLDELSYGDLASVGGGPADPQTRYGTVWAWLLLLHLVESLERDEAARVAASREDRRAIEGLRALGLLPLPRLTQLVARSSKKSFKASIPRFFEYTEEQLYEGQELQLMQMVAALRATVMRYSTDSRHVVFLDGLDEILTQEARQLTALAALILEVSRLNNEFRAAGRPYKIVVACRTDIFDRLPGANKNKIRRDSSQVLDWFDDPRDPDRTRLVRLVNLRARHSLGREVNVFDEFFPPAVDGRPVRRYLLDHTRHLPRDMLQLMKSIQRFSSDDDALTEAQVKSGARDYSNDYFLPELRDELHGYLDPVEIGDALMLLASLGSPRFTMDDLHTQAVKLRLEGLDLEVLVHTLFECSGIGMVEPGRGRRPLHTFKYRNRTARLLPGRQMLIHGGALKALNIERRQRPPGRSTRGTRARGMQS